MLCSFCVSCWACVNVQSLHMIFFGFFVFHIFFLFQFFLFVLSFFCFFVVCHFGYDFCTSWLHFFHNNATTFLQLVDSLRSTCLWWWWRHREMSCSFHYANLSVISTRNDESKGHASKGNESYEQVTMKAGKNISNITRQVIIAGRPGRRQVAMKKAWWKQRPRRQRPWRRWRSQRFCILRLVTQTIKDPLRRTFHCDTICGFWGVLQALICSSQLSGMFISDYFLGVFVIHNKTCFVGTHKFSTSWIFLFFCNIKRLKTSWEEHFKHCEAISWCICWVEEEW